MSRFRNFLAIGTIWTLVGLVLPEDLRALSYIVGAVAIIAVILVFSRDLEEHVRRVTNLLLLAGAFSLGGVVVRGLYGMSSGQEFPFPSPGDALTLVTYPLLAWAILKIVRQRVGRIGFDLVMDALVVGASAAVVQWSLLIEPLLRDNDVSLDAKVIQSVYAVMGIGVLLAATMLLVAGGHRSTSNRLLAGALVIVFFMDTLGTTLSLLGRAETAVLLLAPVGYVLAGAGILHPSIGLITSRPSDQQSRRGISNKRIAVMALALVAPPAVVVGFIIGNADDRLMLPAVGSLMLAPLVVVRLAGLVRDREQLASQESALRSVGERLVVSRTTDDVVAAITDGVSVLVGKTLVNVELRGKARSLASEVAPDGRALDEIVGAATKSETLRAGELIELAGGGNHRVAGLVVADGACRGALLVSTRARLDAPTRRAISSLCREAAIGLKAVEQTEKTVRERSEARFESLIRNSSDILVVLNLNWELVYVSSVAERQLGYPISSLPLSVLAQIRQSQTEEFGRSGTVLDLIHPEDRPTADAWLKSITHGEHQTVELRVQHFTGDYFWFEFVGTDMTHDPNIYGVVVNAREISDRKQAEEQLQRSESRFRALVQNSSDLVVVVDAATEIVYASPSVSRVVQLNRDQIFGAKFNEVFRDHDLRDELFFDDQNALNGELVEFRFRGRDDKWHIVETAITDLSNQPEIGGFVLNARDVTDRKAMEQQLFFQATHDDLTGLSNRAHALSDLSMILSKSAGATTVALLVMDIDEFKDVNDSLGHDVGDELLKELSNRLRSSLAFGDVAARIAGDEFIVIVERAHGEDQIMDLAYDLMDEVSEPFNVHGREISISVSAGIAFDHDRRNTAELMLRNADTAMYRAKRLGRAQIVVFEPHMHTATFDRLELRADLARAVAHNQFEAFYQPVVNLATNRIVGAEALVRWRHPQRGLVGPNLFIPLAEETGMINVIGEWMLAQACLDLSIWRQDLGELMDKFTISVNLSPHQLRSDQLLNSVQRILHETALPADRLVMEITESTLVTETGGAVDVMRKLRDLGIKLSIDDFGTGYSSLGYIQQFDFDVLKIDKSFVDDIDKNTNKRIVKTIIELAQNLGVKTIAEGIEERSQIEVLRELSCKLGQGYVFSRPVPLEEFRLLLDQQVLVPTNDPG